MLLPRYNLNKKKKMKRIPFAIDISKEYIIIQAPALTLKIKTIHIFPKTSFGNKSKSKTRGKTCLFLVQES